MATEAQMTANRKNAESSTGPTSQEGKARSSLNAIKTGLTARTMVFTPEDAQIYQQFSARLHTKYAPVDDDEKDLVQVIIDCEWRLRDVAPLEAAILAGGRDKCAHLVADVQDPVQREALLRAEIYFMFKKDLTNIALQDRRISNKLQKAEAKLEALRAARVEARRNDLDQAKRAIEGARANNRGTPDLKLLGFDFSLEEFDAYWTAARRSGGKISNLDKFLAKYRAEKNAAAA